MKTVKIQVRWAAAQPGQDRRLPGVATHIQGSGGRPASDLGWGSSSKTAPGSLSTGSPAGRRLNVQSGQRKGGKCAAAPYPSVAVRDRGH